MTVLLSVASRRYTTRDNDLPFNIAANAALLQVTLTHANTTAAWPDGALLTVVFDWTGVDTDSVTFGGGQHHNKDGSIIAGNIFTAIAVNKPPDVTSGTARITMLQPFTTAVVVESF